MKKLSKRIIVFSIVLLFFSVVCLQNAFAAEDSSTVVPLYTGIMSGTVNTNVSSGGYATSTCRVTLLPNYTADVTMQLKYGSGSVSGTWTDSGSGTISMEKGKYVMSGHDYYTSVHVVVYDSTGKIVSDITIDSDTVSY